MEAETVGWISGGWAGGQAGGKEATGGSWQAYAPHSTLAHCGPDGLPPAV